MGNIVIKINQSKSVVATGNGDPTGIVVLLECVAFCGIKLLATDRGGLDGLFTAVGGCDGDDDDTSPPQSSS